MSKNKLYNKSYFCKRLRDANFLVKDLNIPYADDDDRRWTIVVNSKNEYKHNIIITCFKNDEGFCFKFQGQRFDSFLLPTKGMGIIIKILNSVFTNKTKTEKEVEEVINE